ncbi:NAD-dependent epimerase/dehydratase family protein [Flavobacterium sp. LM4]|uniref:NAD-dependent epimerase/dehydratase family protein n=1 Tax=Flavobacterium sp. LM4 TaxID=1938609 RepID=UPI000992E9AE|nr:NAD-dependent epimerase/dehydratase family protein [Flavobacterium sp. LM4]OOV18770.1 hypothetical protein BXU10_03525 [Flavobacterium sp. LM4]
MNNKKILICGYKSFAAEGLAALLTASGYSVDCFSRGIENKAGTLISGDVNKMHTNKYLEKEYDILINFTIIKDESVEENIKYLESLHLYCNKYVKNLLHVSSISVYKNEESVVNEETEIEFDSAKKGSYAALKVESDKFLLKQTKNYNLSFLRPGFIVSSEKESSTAGICIHLPFNCALLLGNKKTSLPLIDRQRMHFAIEKIIASQNRLSCYLLLENRNETKISFLKKRFKGKVFQLPSWGILPIASLFNRIKLLNKTKYWQIRGLFKATYFDSSITESNLKLSLTYRSVCVIGSGVYGSYAIHTITEKYPDSNITLLEVGNDKIKTEKEIGFSTKLLNEKYSGLSDGRYFGLGGTSNRWGGQLLFFTKNDFKKPTQFIKDIIEISEKYKIEIFRKFKIKDKFEEKILNENQFSKTGLWLGYFDRNLFKFFKIEKLKNVKIEQNTRVVKLISERNKIVAAEIEHNKEVKIVYFDSFILAAGAFESNRILLQSGLINEEKIYFSDHLSQKVFKIIGNSRIGEEDYKFKVSGAALITKRIIGEVDDYSYFANPIYNSDFPFFQNFKKLLFKKEISFDIIKSILLDLPYVVKFIYCMLLKKEVYIYKNMWNLYVDIENPKSNSFITLGKETQKQSVIKDLDVYFDLDKEKINGLYTQAIEEVKNLLVSNNIKFDLLSDDFSFEKIEDTYHPYNMAMSDSENLRSFYNRYNSLLIVNTGVLPRAGGINITAALFPLIDDYVDNLLYKNIQ